MGERDELLGKLIHDYKYQSVRALSKSLAELLAAALPDHSCPIVLVPLPTATHHIRARALDHTYQIAKYLAKLKGYQVARLLLRAENTVQVGADSKTRLAQAASAYRLNPRLKIDPSVTYFLLDDVWTTGASMKAALHLLEKSGGESLAAAVIAVNSLT